MVVTKVIARHKQNSREVLLILCALQETQGGRLLCAPLLCPHRHVLSLTICSFLLYSFPHPPLFFSFLVIQAISSLCERLYCCFQGHNLHC